MNEIIPRLWLGDMIDARDAPHNFHVLSVMWHGEPGMPERSHKIQTTDYKTFQEYAGAIIQAGGVYADEEKMDEAAEYIYAKLADHQDVLVHCAYGIERSPLTVVWYLMRHHGMNLKEAYDLVMEKRKEVQYRGTWLPEYVRIEGVLKP